MMWTDRLKVRQVQLSASIPLLPPMYHYELKSRGIATEGEAKRRQDREEQCFQQRYKDRIDDPFYNPHFSRYDKPFTVLRPPRWGI